MRKQLQNLQAVIIAIFAIASAAHAATWYVDANVSGGAEDGTSWSNAFPTLTEALSNQNLADDDQIWVAQGTYHPSQAGDIDASFVLPHGVDVLGGFDGTEQSADERDPATNVTTLSGDLNEDNDDPGCNVNDDSRHVVQVEQPGPGEQNEWAVLDGFTFLS